jgi:DNA replication protein DnaC
VEKNHIRTQFQCNLSFCLWYPCLLTSNPPFSEWERIFQDPMTTPAAIDRLVHHSVILELILPSYRLEGSRKNNKKEVSSLKISVLRSGNSNCR